MNFIGTIESISSVSQGTSKKGYPFKACTVVMCDAVQGGVADRIWASAHNNACDQLQHIADTADSQGFIPGRFAATLEAHVHQWTGHDGQTHSGQELRLMEIVPVN